MTPFATLVRAAAAALAAACLLCACGGGDVDDDNADGRVTVNPPSCEASGACR